MRYLLLLFFGVVFTFGIHSQHGYNQWSLDANLGLNNATRPFAPGYVSNYLGFLHADLGARYMLSNKLGVKLDVGFDRIKNDQSGNIQGPIADDGSYTFVKSGEFQTHYFRISLQSVIDLGRMMEFEKLDKNLSLLMHFGFGFSSLKNQKNSVWFENWKTQGTDEMMNVIIGLTPQYRIHEDWALHLDFSLVGNAWQSKTWDFTENSFEKGIHGRLFNFSVGASYYLGKHSNHYDWVVTCCGSGGIPEGVDSVRVIETVKTIETIRYVEKETKKEVKPPVLDTDGDGVPDDVDKCPNTYGDTEDGCPVADTDGDGVPDEVDNCPKTPGTKLNKGCPELDLYVKKVFNEALIGVKFETNRDVITERSFLILDKVVKVMQDNPSFFLEINGHTDNVGREEPNMVLSKARAEAVLKYLVDKGIDPSRMKAIGHGETRPLASNDNPAGREQNRRVEFVVRYE